MADYIQMDKRKQTMGRVIPFRLKAPEGIISSLRERMELTAKHPYKVEGDRLIEAGFAPIHLINGVICTSYVEEEEKRFPRFGEEVLIRVEKNTKIYDLLGDSNENFILTGASDVGTGRYYLKKYLDTVGIDEEKVAIDVICVGQEILKEIFYDKKVFPRGFRIEGQSIIDMHTKLAKILRDKFYEALKATGIDSESWTNIRVVLPAIPGTNQKPPMVHIYLNGFTIRSSFLEPATWEYVNYVLRTIEMMTRHESIIKKKWTTLFDFELTNLKKDQEDHKIG